MTGLVALDVVIGLAFIYLLYSLLTTLIAEIVATNLGLRARNLHSAIKRMLQDDGVNVLKSFSKQKKGTLIDAFYNHPEVKFLSPNKLFSKPSTIKPESFSKTLLFLLKEKGKGTSIIEKVKTGLTEISLDPDTKAYMQSLLEDANHDIEKFKTLLESWYDNVMKQATEWYKRNLQIMLFFIGFVIAVLFNVNTYKIVEKLSTDKEARSQLVTLASSYLDDNPQSILLTTNDTSGLISDSIYRAKIDTLLKVKHTLEKQIESTQTILGGGSWLPDSMVIIINKHRAIPEFIEADLLPKLTLQSAKEGHVKYAVFSTGDKIQYLFRLLIKNFFGFAITAFALSLGAPFWFDLLNRFMKLRGTISEVTNGKDKTPDNK